MSTATLSCPVCGSRKGKRECPALGRQICAVCCGTKRLVEISCPPTCAYLSSAKAHPAAVVQRRQERDLRFFVPTVGDLSERQLHLVLLFHTVIVKHTAGAIPALQDVDVAEAAAALAATLETSSKGIIYDHQAASVPAQRLLALMRAALAEVQPGNAAARLERDAAAVLRRIEHGARTAAKALEGDLEPVYIGLLRRMLQDAPAKGAESGPGTGTAEPGRVPGEPSIIITD
jgi:hypothetical protein